MRLALAQTNPLIGDFAGNAAAILAMTRKAAAAGCELAVFPELALSGYPPQDLLQRPAFITAHERALATLISEMPPGIAVLAGVIEIRSEKKGLPLANAALLFERGGRLSCVRKKLLPSYDVFDERRYFEPGVGENIVNYKGLRLGITICEDIWSDARFLDPDGGEYSLPPRLYRINPLGEIEAALPRVDLLANLSASPFHMGKTAMKNRMLAEISRSLGVALCHVNQTGGQDSLLFDGGSVCYDAAGRELARAAAFCEDLVVVDIARGQGEIRPRPVDTTDEVWQALVMGVRDYTSKCGFSRALVGLSGGIDSALVCALACEALGAAKVRGIFLPSPYTSQMSREDAEELARNLGCGFDTIGISPVVDAVVAQLAPLFASRKADVTEQNIQARVRGNILMALSNKFGALLLSTGNKSEMAVGYCTLYGDMSGGLAVLGDVPKTLVYRLAAHANRDRPLIPARSISRAPTAELAPGQKDEDDLPPYAVLDPILAAYLEENLGVEDIVGQGFDRAVVHDVVRRIQRNEYKRKQAPPCLRVTGKAFGPGRRYPTAQRFVE